MHASGAGVTRGPELHGAGMERACWDRAGRPLQKHDSVVERPRGIRCMRERTRLKKMQYRADLLDGFIAETGLNLTPS
ncbi:hypothetical protein GCM10010211_78950 [Streptomyces albospinus]|uniref:Transposase n=1 Tax=Streptomyces albospinus TaxID=285515 RepID=A0ABQ2VMM5_9ACTN|nr:hypothetical protein GCM10010211_78950 [Streptomyces albospinus]